METATDASSTSPVYSSPLSDDDDDMMRASSARTNNVDSVTAGFGRGTESSCGQKLSDSKTNSVIKFHRQRGRDGRNDKAPATRWKSKRAK